MFKTLLSRRSEEPFFLITVLLLIIIAVYNWVIALLALILIGGAYVLTRKNHNERNREISQFFDAISKSVDQASTYAVQNLPIGIAIIDMQSNLCWANSVFRDWVGDIDNDQQLDHIMPNLKVDKFWGKSGYFFEHIGERYYRVVYKYLQTEAAEDDNYLILYFEDITDTERQKLNSLAAVPVFCDIEIDNLEEVAKGMTAVQRATLVTNVNNCLIGELSGHNCFIWAYGNEKYIACMSRDTLEYYKEDNFSFLEKIRSIHTVNRIPVTLSMGIALFPSEVIAAGKANFSELATKARAGLDLALGRGIFMAARRAASKRTPASGPASSPRRSTNSSIRATWSWSWAMNGKITTASVLPSAWPTWPVWQASRYTSSSATRPMPSGAWKTRSWTIRTSRTCSFRQRLPRTSATARPCCSSSIPIART